MRDRMVTAGDICIAATVQSRPDREMVALEFFARAKSVPGTKRTGQAGLAVSVDGGGPEVAGKASSRHECP